MKTPKYIVTLTVLTALIATNAFTQSNCDTEVVKTLKGIWVKTTNSPDTLKFSIGGNLENNFELKLAEGTKPPRKPEGLYKFRTHMGVMIINWCLSSNVYDSPSFSYKIDLEKNLLTIGNFYSASNEQNTLTFKKIK